MSQMLHFYNVGYRYKGGYAVKEITFSLLNGEFVFLVGLSGAGKSTILKLINLELNPQQGNIILDSLNTMDVRQKQIPLFRRKTGVIFQDFKLLRDRNVFENVAFAMYAVGARRKKIKRQVLEVLKDVGLTHKRFQYPDQLSGGEQQRVAIARAIVNEPLIVLADEPTGNLDDSTALGILDLLYRINSQGTAVLMATHKKDLAAKAGKRTIHIIDGRIEP